MIRGPRGATRASLETKFQTIKPASLHSHFLTNAMLMKGTRVRGLVRGEGHQSDNEAQLSLNCAKAPNNTKRSRDNKSRNKLNPANIFSACTLCTLHLKRNVAPGGRFSRSLFIYQPRGDVLHETERSRFVGCER